MSQIEMISLEDLNATVILLDQVVEILYLANANGYHSES